MGSLFQELPKFMTLEDPLCGQITINLTSLAILIVSISWNQYDRKYYAEGYFADFNLHNGQCLRLEMKTSRSRT